MTLYIALFIGLCFLTVYEIYSPLRLSPIIYVAFIGGAFWILSFMRWENGTDWQAYYSIYTYYSQSPQMQSITSGGVEPGYLFINYALAWANSYRVFLALFGLLVILFKSVPILRWSPYICLSFLLYYTSIFGDIFFVRQSLAVSICFYSLYVSFKGHRLASILLVLVATSIHYSSIIFLIALLRKNKSFRPVVRDVLILATVATCSFVAWKELSQTILPIFASIQYISDRIMSYAVDNTKFSTAENTTRDLMRIAEKLLIYVYISARQKHICKNLAALYTRLLDTYFIGAVLVCAFSLTAVTMVRLSSYFTITEIILIPIALSSHKKYGKILALLIMLTYGGLRLYSTITPFYDLYVPYKLYGLNIP